MDYIEKYDHIGPWASLVPPEVPEELYPQEPFWANSCTIVEQSPVAQEYSTYLVPHPDGSGRGLRVVGETSSGGVVARLATPEETAAWQDLYRLAALVCGKGSVPGTPPEQPISLNGILVGLHRQWRVCGSDPEWGSEWTKLIVQLPFGDEPGRAKRGLTLTRDLAERFLAATRILAPGQAEQVNALMADIALPESLPLEEAKIEEPHQRQDTPADWQALAGAPNDLPLRWRPCRLVGERWYASRNHEDVIFIDCTYRERNPSGCWVDPEHSIQRQRLKLWFVPHPDGSGRPMRVIDVARRSAGAKIIYRLQCRPATADEQAAWQDMWSLAAQAATTGEEVQGWAMCGGETGFYISLNGLTISLRRDASALVYKYGDAAQLQPSGSGIGIAVRLTRAAAKIWAPHVAGFLAEWFSLSEAETGIAPHWDPTVYRMCVHEANL